METELAEDLSKKIGLNSTRRRRSVAQRNTHGSTPSYVLIDPLINQMQSIGQISRGDAFKTQLIQPKTYLQRFMTLSRTAAPLDYPGYLLQSAWPLAELTCQIQGRTRSTFRMKFVFKIVWGQLRVVDLQRSGIPSLTAKKSAVPSSPGLPEEIAFWKTND